MTFRSLKNLQITRLSRQVWTTSLSLAGLAVLCAGSADAQRPGQRYLLTFEREQPRIQLIEGEQNNAEGSTLERLKERSAQDRFERLRKAREKSPSPEPLPLLEPAETTTIPVLPPAPAENKLPRLPEVDELERSAPFVTSQQRPQTGSPQPAVPPTPGGNQLPRLPSLDELEEFDPFGNIEPQLQSVTPQGIAHPVPAPAALPSLTAPVFSAMQDTPPAETLPVVVRSLSDIQPSYDYQFTVKDQYLNDDRTTADPSRVPDDATFPSGVYHERLSPDSLFAWEASNLYHNPLYFEDPTLERYGHVYPCVQPLVSVTRMGVQLLGLPYQSVIDTPHTKRYTLGWYRPGEPAPHLCYQVPLNPEAAVAEGLGITTGFLVIP